MQGPFGPKRMPFCKAIPMGRHVFNLGHGIRQGTDPGIITEVVTAVRDWDKGVRGE